MNISKIKILAIDDIRDNLVSLKALIKDSFPDARTLTASNGQQGLELAGIENPDVILLDIIMPGMDGFEVCKKLKLDERLREIPVVFITALKADKANRIMALEVGGEGFLTKPIDESELTAQIRAMVKIKQANIEKLNEKTRLADLIAQQTRELKENYLATLNLLEDLRNENDARKISDDAMRVSEEKYRTIFENVQDVFYRVDMNGNVLEISPSIKHFSQFDLARILGNPISDLYYDINDRVELLKAISLKGAINDYEIRLKGHNGVIINTSINANLIMDANGNPLHIDGSIRDISERIKAEEAMRESEEKFRSIFENHSAVKLIIDPETGQITDANRAASIFYGWSKEELIHMKLVDLSTSSDEDIFSSFQLIRKREKVHFEFQHCCKDGSIKDVEVFSSKVSISGKEFLHSIIHDISDKKKAEQQIRLLSKSIEQSPVSVIITDPKGRIEYVNPTFCMITGYSLDEMMGENPQLLNNGKQTNTFYQELWSKVLSGNVWTGEFRNKRKNGEQYWENASISPIVNENGEITHLVGIMEDITEKRKMHEELLLAKDKAEAGDRLKSAFINNISHEIRTPLNGILGFSEMLMNPEITNENKVMFNSIIKKSSARLLETITNYMDISMIVSGNVLVNNKTFNPRQVLDDLKNSYHAVCDEKHLIMSVQLSEINKEIQFHSDPEILSKILIHLLDNAFKFTQLGSIEVGLRIRYQEPEFFVKDTGRGIDKDKIRVIFDIFSQADMSMTRGYEGSGLGLSISYGLVKILGGNLSVHSEVGTGSEFFFTLPSSVIINLPEEHEQNTNKSPQKVKPLILVAEDEEYNYQLIEIILEQSGYDIIRAENGAEAVTICRKNPAVDLVIMDLRMPILGGIKATQLIKDLQPDLPIIALTAYVSQKDELEALACGCNNFIPKPVDKEKLLRIMANLLGR